MDHKLWVILGSALVSLALLLIGRRAYPRLFNQSSSMGLVLTIYPLGFALFDDLSWHWALMIAAAGLSIWKLDLFHTHNA